MSHEQEHLAGPNHPPTIDIDTEFARAAHGIKQLETELADLEQELDDQQQRLDDLLKKVEPDE